MGYYIQLLEDGCPVEEWKYSLGYPILMFRCAEVVGQTTFRSSGRGCLKALAATQTEIKNGRNELSDNITLDTIVNELASWALNIHPSSVYTCDVGEQLAMCDPNTDAFYVIDEYLGKLKDAMAGFRDYDFANRDRKFDIDFLEVIPKHLQHFKTSNNEERLGYISDIVYGLNNDREYYFDVGFNLPNNDMEEEREREYHAKRELFFILHDLFGLPFQVVSARPNKVNEFNFHCFCDAEKYQNWIKNNVFDFSYAYPSTYDIKHRALKTDENIARVFKTCKGRDGLNSIKMFESELIDCTEEEFKARFGIDVSAASGEPEIF